MKHEHEMIIAVITVSLTLLLGTVCSVFAQSNKLDSILKNAQKSLEDNTNSSIPKKTNSFPQQTIPLNRNVPNNVDVYVQTKLSYDAIDQLWYFPKEVTINFTKPNKICPDRFCKQQLDEDYLIHHLLPVTGTNFIFMELSDLGQKGFDR